MVCCSWQRERSEYSLDLIVFVFLLPYLNPVVQVAYFGPASQALDYLANLGLHCTLHYNPADYICKHTHLLTPWQFGHIHFVTQIGVLVYVKCGKTYY